MFHQEVIFNREDSCLSNFYYNQMVLLVNYKQWMISICTTIPCGVAYRPHISNPGVCLMLWIDQHNKLGFPTPRKTCDRSEILFQAQQKRGDEEERINKTRKIETVMVVILCCCG